MAIFSGEIVYIIAVILTLLAIAIEKVERYFINKTQYSRKCESIMYGGYTI